MAFNEDTRVKIPAILHLTKLGYTYKDLGKNNSSKSGGTIMPNGNQYTLKHILLVRPEEKAVTKFNNFIAPVFKELII
jgi:hypothetical protein